MTEGSSNFCGRKILRSAQNDEHITKTKFYLSLIAAIFLVEFIVLASTTFTLWPEIVLYPWLHNNGFLLYKDIVNPYFPGLTWVLSGLTKIFGYDPNVFIFFTWGYILLSQIFFTYMVQKVFKNKVVTVLSLFICATLSVIFEANGLWFDLAVTLPLLLAFYSLLQRKYLFAGIFLAIGLLIKQTVVWAIIGSILYAAGTYLYFHGVKKIPNTKYLILNTFLLVAPLITFLVLMGVLFYIQGALTDFFFWAIKLPFGALQKTPGFVELPTKRNFLIMLVVFWPSIVFLPKIIKEKTLAISFVFFVSTYIFAFPRFGYFHLMASVPFFSIIAARIFSTRKIIGALYLSSIIVLFVIVVKKTIPFSIRFFDNETYRLAESVKKETKGESFFLQNSPQQIYFINNVLPPKPWSINFPWYLENGGVQDGLIKGIEKEGIKWVVLENYQKKLNTFSPGAYKPMELQKYIDDNFVEYKKMNSNTILMIKKND